MQNTSRRTMLLSHPAHFVALGFGSGLSPLGPGTAGSLLAWGLWQMAAIHITHTLLGVALIFAAAGGTWACKITAEQLNESDPSSIVWDEMVAVWLILWVISPAHWTLQLLAISVFRLLDIFKAGPIKWLDTHLKGTGWVGAIGIMADDIAAALCVSGLYFSAVVVHSLM